MQDAWRAYLELAMGLTEAPRKKAQDVARRLVGSGGATAAQLQALGEELVTTGAANREALTKLVRFEVDRALGAVGLATADEVAELTRRVHDLERQLREARASEPTNTPTASPSERPDPTRVARPGDRLVPSDGPAGAPVSAHAPDKPTPEQPAPDKPTPEQPAAGQAVAEQSAAVQPVAKKAVAKKAVAKKAIAKKPPATISRTDDEAPTPAAMPAKKAVRKQPPGATE
ncbi:phasin family protein [Micromonospora taraxaci]|uniref:phasin family protein n=1 Tax=Micromonospora taraxaci TaxID=1316803 RepID=UPI0033B0332C